MLRPNVALYHRRCVGPLTERSSSPRLSHLRRDDSTRRMHLARIILQAQAARSKSGVSPRPPYPLFLVTTRKGSSL